MKKHTHRIYIILALILFVIFFITTNFILSPKNSAGNISIANTYIVVSEIFIFLVLLILFILSFIKLSFINILKNAILIPIIIYAMIILHVFNRLNILMDITIPLAGIILYILLSIQ